MIDGRLLPDGMISGGKLTTGWGSDVQTHPELERLQSDTIRMTEERLDDGGGTHTGEELFDWFCRWDQRELWLCKGPGCDCTQYTCPITMEEYSFCSRQCADYYKRTYWHGDGKKTRWQMRPDAKWCSTCGFILACDDFECCLQWCSKLLQSMQGTIRAASDGNEGALAELRLYAEVYAKFTPGMLEVEQSPYVDPPDYPFWMAEMTAACRKKVAVAYEILCWLVTQPGYSDEGKDLNWLDRLWNGEEDTGDGTGDGGAAVDDAIQGQAVHPALEAGTGAPVAAVDADGPAPTEEDITFPFRISNLLI
eukprot:1695102-Rhodomonas_salina.1